MLREREVSTDPRVKQLVVRRARGSAQRGEPGLGQRLGEDADRPRTDAVQGEQVYFVAGPLAGAVLCSTVPGGFAAQAATFDGVAGSLKLAGMP